MLGLNVCDCRPCLSAHNLVAVCFAAACLTLQGPEDAVLVAAVAAAEAAAR